MFDSVVLMKRFMIQFPLNNSAKKCYCLLLELAVLRQYQLTLNYDLQFDKFYQVLHKIKQ